MATPLGELVRKRTERSGQLRFDERYCHDPLGRVRDVHTGIAPDGGGALTQYRTQTFYDTQHGWPKQIIYPGERVSVRWVRNDRGAPVEVRNMAGDGLLRRLTAMDQHGGEAGVELGNNWHLATELDPATGVMTRQTTRLGGSVIDQWDYRYDAFGNLTRQTRVGGTNGEESFYYDLQQRMVGRRTGTGPAYTVSYAYTVTGNIDFKSDYSRTEAGAYTYHATRPNAVERVKRPSGLADDVYGYDANGNLVSGNQISASYDGANRAARLSRGGAQQHFEYAPGGARFRQVNVAKGEETRYVGGIEEVRSQISGTLLYVRHSVAANVWITVDCPAGNCGAASVRYAVQDRLGSTVLFGTSTGAVTDRKTYDPYGKPREGNFSENITSPFANIFSTAASGGLLGRDTVRGFTAHEHLDEVRLIHMNGRVFDYTLGRFHAVDPIIQFPSNSQNLNPYSYILNNPMAGTDPSGYAAEEPCTGSRVSCPSATSMTQVGAMPLAKEQALRKSELMAKINSTLDEGGSVEFKGLTAAEVRDVKNWASNRSNGALQTTDSLGAREKRGADAGADKYSNGARGFTTSRNGTHSSQRLGPVARYEASPFRDIGPFQESPVGVIYIYFKYEQGLGLEPEERLHLQAEWEHGAEWIYAKNGVPIDIRGSNSPRGSVEVLVSNMVTRSYNRGNFIAMNFTRSPSVFAHELGHRLGLNDRYRDIIDTNGRAVSEPYEHYEHNLMANSWYGRFELTHKQRAHIRHNLRGGTLARYQTWDKVE